MQGFKFDLTNFIPFRDVEVCKRVKRIKKEQIRNHPNPKFKIEIIEKPEAFYFEFALDIVTRIRNALEEGKKLVLILPAEPRCLDRYHPMTFREKRSKITARYTKPVRIRM